MIILVEYLMFDLITWKRLKKNCINRINTCVKNTTNKFTQTKHAAPLKRTIHGQNDKWSCWAADKASSSPFVFTCGCLDPDYPHNSIHWVIDCLLCEAFNILYNYFNSWLQPTKLIALSAFMSIDFPRIEISRFRLAIKTSVKSLTTLHAQL